jgi:hypothetical protein
MKTEIPPEGLPQNALLSLKQLATRLNVPYSFVRGMKFGGLAMSGNKVNEVGAREWLKKHPNFDPGECQTQARGDHWRMASGHNTGTRTSLGVSGSNSGLRTREENLNALLNLKQLAERLGVGYYFTCAMKNAGLPMPGNKTSEADARSWLKHNPHFVPFQCRTIAAGRVYEAGRKQAQ